MLKNIQTAYDFIINYLIIKAPNVSNWLYLKDLDMLIIGKRNYKPIQGFILSFLALCLYVVSAKTLQN
jgi:hypothetical protein